MCLLTNSEVMPEYDSLLDFVSCNHEDPSVVAFRTSALYDSIATVFCLWLPALIVSRLTLDKFEEPPAPDYQTLHPPTEDDEGNGRFLTWFVGSCKRRKRAEIL
jgi:hypothetical protein